MKNFGLSDLRIVQPRCKLEQAKTMAVHAQDVLENAMICETLLDAVGGLEFVAATTARLRRDHSPPLTPREVAPSFVRATSSAVVFGREEHGLFNEELDLCTVHIRIPTDAQYASMNLAQAVQVVVYELMMGRTNPEPLPATQPLASRASHDGLYAHLAEFMLEVGYTDAPRKDHMLRRFRQVLDRAALSEYDVGLLRGLLSQGLWAARKGKGTAIPGTMPWPSATGEVNPRAIPSVAAVEEP
jgi:tRNA/rRNA methyltransferase